MLFGGRLAPKLSLCSGIGAPKRHPGLYRITFIDLSVKGFISKGSWLNLTSKWDSPPPLSLYLSISLTLSPSLSPSLPLSLFIPSYSLSFSLTRSVSLFRSSLSLNLSHFSLSLSLCHSTLSFSLSYLDTFVGTQVKTLITIPDEFNQSHTINAIQLHIHVSIYPTCYNGFWPLATCLVISHNSSQTIVA